MIQLNVLKHDGRIEAFDEEKIFMAVLKAGAGVTGANQVRETVATELRKVFTDTNKPISVDMIHDTVEEVLMKLNAPVAKKYILFRQQRSDYRDAGSPLNREIDAIEKEMHHDNANTGNCAASKMYGIAELVEKKHNLSRMGPIHARNHKLGRIYIHK